MSEPLDPISRYARTQELFLEARELEGADLPAFLDEACGDDMEMRAELELLLQHDLKHLDAPSGAIGPVAENSPVRDGLEALLAETSVPSEPALPEFIGEYEIRRKLGEGGMGTVYESFHGRLHRTVALKVLRAGALSEQAERRFGQESEFLGRLEHPGIGRIYDSGRAETAFGSQPYFAMELVKGEPLTDYAKRNRLDIPERIELVARVADAVQHAHQEGVIHRDLKPDNILVDSSGQPKILDFGIARASDLDTQRTTQQTYVGQILGTLAYMSPEQASGDPANIDNRTDVYALGVLLYELLTGELPLDVSTRSLPEALRIIQDEEPRRPSTLFATLRGDVETIVMKALEKDRERRYASAAALAVDLRHFLQHEPIDARPSSRWYVLSKFVLRNKAIVVAGLVVFVSIVANVSVLLGEGNGALESPGIGGEGFVESQIRDVGDYPHSGAIADLNGDKILDVVTANQYSGNVSVLLGVGDGTFDAADEFEAGEQVRSVAIGDLNGDTYPDLVTADELTATVSVLLGAGDGTFSLPTTFDVGKEPFCVALGHLNGDQFLDLVTANTKTARGSGPDVSVLLGNGDGTFRKGQDIGNGNGCRAVAIGDLNGDRNLDIVATHQDSDEVWVLLGAGDGSFILHRRLELSDQPHTIAIGYLNGDDKLDLVTGNYDEDTVSVLLGVGDGTFGTALDKAVDRGGPRSVAIGDMNGDELLDVVVANQKTKDLCVLLGAGDGDFRDAILLGVGYKPLVAILGDLDGDEDLDIVAVNAWKNEVVVLLNQP